MSWYNYLPLLIVPFALWLFIRGRRQSKDLLQKTEHMRAGAFVQRLGLTLVEGDPNFHLVMSEAENSLADNFKSGLKSSNILATNLKDVRIVATGQPYQRPTEFRFEHKVDLSAAIPVMGRTRTTTFGCSLTVRINANVPPFEILARTQNQYTTMHRIYPELPQANFGNPMADSQFEVFTLQPQVLGSLANVLGEFVGQFAVHIVGSGQSLFLSFDSWMMYGLGDGAEILQYGLECVACALEGRPVAYPRPQINPGGAMPGQMAAR